VKNGYGKGIIAILAVLVIVAILINPWNISHQGNGESQNALIIVSLNFGGKEIIKEEVATNISVMEALKSITNVTTAYNGKFVVGIDNITQDQDHAWFYYVNGFLANVGASEYIIQPGDVIRWDFHRWEFSGVISAELSDFPEPFVHGYGGKISKTIIIANESFLPIAEELMDFLKVRGVNVEIKSTINTSQLEKNNIIVVGYPEFLGDKLNELYGKLGWDYRVEEPFILDKDGKRYKGAFIQISQSPFNPKGLDACENVIMWIYGSDYNYTRSAVSALINGDIDAFWYFEGEEI